jgi:hypothetical protein
VTPITRRPRKHANQDANGKIVQMNERRPGASPWLDGGGMCQRVGLSNRWLVCLAQHVMAVRMGRSRNARPTSPFHLPTLDIYE